MDKSFCFFFQKEVLSCWRWVSLKAAWYNAKKALGGPQPVSPYLDTRVALIQGLS
jgi:hypothetical protein